MPNNRSLVDVIGAALARGRWTAVGHIVKGQTEATSETIFREQAREVIAALSAAGLPATALEGVMNQTHVVVPVEPTTAMKTAGAYRAGHFPPSHDIAHDVYDGMIAAAPPSDAKAAVARAALQAEQKADKPLYTGQSDGWE